MWHYGGVAMKASDSQAGLAPLTLAGYWVALAWQAWHGGLTFDEPTHMLGAYLYWLNRPDLYPQDLPPLIKMLTGWIPRALNIPLFLEMPSWQTAWKQDVASGILDRLSREQIQELFYLMRLALTVFPVAVAWLIWHWGQILFGTTAALLLLLAAVLSPTPLAHGCLLKPDLATTFAYLLFTFWSWRFWLTPNRKTSLALGGSVLLAILAKMSMLIVPGLAVLLIAARAVKGGGSFRPWLGWAIFSIAVIPYIGLLAAYKFEARRMSSQELADLRSQTGFSKPVLAVAGLLRYIPSPVDVQKAVLSLGSYQQYGAPSCLLGEARSSGHPIYYPLALAVKVAIPVQILFVAGLILLARKAWRRRTVAAHWFLLLPFCVYLGLAAQSELQLGLRLVLPAMPFMPLLGGLAVEQALITRRGRFTILVLLGWLAGASAFIYPQGIAYFNEWVGGPSQGWKYLVDSNLDWGQNLPELANYIRENRVKKLRLYYFGFDKLHRYGLQDKVEVKAPPWGPALVSETRLRPEPGIYAISATLLPGHFFPPEYRDYFQWFREREPIARAGYSIFIYEVLPTSM